jgi:hypothetical protein
MWPLTLSEGRRLTGFDSRLQVGTGMEEVTVIGRKLRIDDLRNFYSSPNSMIKKYEMGGACSRHERV